MKIIRLTIYFGVICLALSCNKKDILQPEEMGLKGTWILFQTSSWDGTRQVYQPVNSIPQQTITFFSSSQFSANNLKDSVFLDVRYYGESYTDIIGPLLFLSDKKDDFTTGTIAGYLINRDTLEIRPYKKISKSFKFRRL
ncbi:hypothetical protein [Salmonirosea aquatica]|uniref:Uncharacterized protein n=1 Tax=Salmonirosea aquatica TaxID=2654236 RepID=A0A7C9BJD2_9BACT|nr:hypothetical protein [Cytophagaceae bacterium SJW1-29]